MGRDPGGRAGDFRRGQAVARSAGLILVDTKYEFGLIDGRPALIDEVHTPDSSRFWVRRELRRRARHRAGAGELRQGVPAHLVRPSRAIAAMGSRPPCRPTSWRRSRNATSPSYERLTGRDLRAGRPAGRDERIAHALAELTKSRKSHDCNRSLSCTVPIIMGSRLDMAHAQAIADALRRVRHCPASCG